MVVAGPAGWPPQLTQWRIGDELGRGGMGVVYSAIDRDNGESRAIKIIRPPAELDTRRDALFRRELENCQSLVHRNIVRTYTFGRAGEIYFLVTELCDGGSVSGTVKSRGLFTVDEAMKMTIDVLAGLEYAHSTPVTSTIASGESVRSTGLVHRDVKPPNILVRAAAGNREYAVSDFGLAKAFGLAGMSGLTKTGTIAGTPEFMCRQQVANYKRTKPEADVWGAAATLYYVLTGFPPRDFPRDRDPWTVVVATQPVPIAKRGVKLPGQLEQVIDEALADRPRIRYQNAAEFRAALEAVWRPGAASQPC